MKNITALTLMISSFIGTNVIAAESNQYSTNKYISAAEALIHVQKINPASYDTIELVEGKDGKQIYLASLAESKPIDIIVIDGVTGENLTTTYLSSKYSLSDVLTSVNKTHQGKILAAHKEFESQWGVIYRVELENQYDEMSYTMLVINANTLQVIESERRDLSQIDELEDELDILIDDYHS